MKHKGYTGLRNLLIVLCIFIVLFIFGIVGLSSSDNPTNYYALLFVSFFVIVTCLVLIPLFMKRKRSYLSALNPSTQFATWTLDDELVKATANQKLTNDQERNKAFITIISFFFLLFTIIFAIIIDSDDRLMFIALMAGIYTIIIAFGLLIPKLTYMTKYKNAKDVYLGENAVIIGHELHIFKSTFETFKSAEYDADNRLLYIHYTSLTRTGQVPYTAQIPVPESEIDTAIAYTKSLTGLK